MSGRSNQEINLNELLQNLKDLDFVARKVSKEMDQKNKIMQVSLQDCKMCRLYIEKNKNRMVNK